jgi:hypothetical protein
MHLDSALGETFKCTTLVSVHKIKTSTTPGDSCIHDTTTGVTSDDNNKYRVSIEETELTADEDDLVDQMQDVIQFFLDLLQVTGGDLDPEKCVWYLIAQIWKNGLTTLMRKRVQRHRAYIRYQKESGNTGTHNSGISSHRRRNVFCSQENHEVQSKRTKRSNYKQHLESRRSIT